jgi:hypothetical protein
MILHRVGGPEALFADYVSDFWKELYRQARIVLQT